jgi:hypothetical protein
MSFTAFGIEFTDEIAPWRESLSDLEREGVTYERWILDDDDGGPGIYRVQFSPAEIYQFVRALVGWDQYAAGGFDAVADRALAKEAAASGLERYGRPGTVCPADFFGVEVESLVCGWRLMKAQRVRADASPQDALVALHQIASTFPTSVKSLTDRGPSKSSFDLSSEGDVQDLLFFLLRSTFADARREEWTPSAAGNAKRIDLAIPSVSILIEVKFVRDARHGRRIADELRTDIESYHSHPACRTVFGFVWDPSRHIPDPAVLERDLSGSRSIKGKSFEVLLRVV